ncbi:MAG: hypothetical protein PHE09_11095 [Oscillospiraceae bacterium]|nr:hypothetical protein [Oscillospiraceae bacterium]
MKKVKEFYKKHETKILIAGGIVLLVVAVKHRKYVKGLEKEIAFYNSQNRILWKSTGKCITINDVKNVLNLNADVPESLYAVVKEGTEYALIILNDSPVILE